MLRKPTVIRKDLEEAWNPGPTPETVVKLRQDVIQGLYKRGRIDGDMLRAAQKIDAIFTLISRGMFVRAIDHRRPYMDPPTTLPPIGLELMTDGQMKHWKNVYMPWSRVEVGVRIGAEQRPRTELVHRIVVDNHGLKYTARAMKVRESAVVDHLRDALIRYCKYAGWC